MQLDHLLSAAQPIPIHAIVALLAFVLGIVQFALPKGTVLHRRVGFVWVTMMALVASTGLFIFELRMFGPFSPIHLLSVFVLFALYRAVMAARTGNIVRHKRTMIGVYCGGLLLAGAFTLLPGRVFYNVFWG